MLLLGILGVLTLMQALRAQGPLEDARAAMEAGRGQLLAGDIATAEASFSQAAQHFETGLDRARHPLIRLASYLPLLGRTPDAVDRMAEAGLLVARAARLTTAAVNDLPGGIGDLAPKDGALPVDILADMSPALDEAEELVDRAVALLEETETSLLVGPVAEARKELAVELPDAQRTITSAAALAREMPGFLGGEGPRHYFFGAQNPAELRGTGGFIGAYSILTVEDGRLEFGPFLPIQSLNQRLNPSPPPPNPDFEERYERFGGTGFWENINMTADFPSAAHAIETLYAESEGEQLDGTILADPFAYSALLGVTGPVDIPSAGRAIDSTTAVPFLTNEAYVVYTDSAQRKAVLGESAKLVMERFMQEGAAADPVAAARTLLQTAANGNLLFHAADEETQEAFEVAGIAGQLKNPEGDYLGVFSNNAAANKVDYYMDTSIRYEVTLDADGSAAALTSVELTNSAPTEGLPAYIIGPFDKRFVAGENRSFVSSYYAEGSQLDKFSAPEELIEVIGSQEELGHPVFSTFIRTESGGSSRLDYETSLPEGWEAVGGSGRYTLMYQGQNTIRPAQLQVLVHLPQGASLVSSSPPFVVDGETAVWTGAPGQELRFDLAFERGEGTSPLAISGIIVAVLLVAGLITFSIVRRRQPREG